MNNKMADDALRTLMDIVDTRDGLSDVEMLKRYTGEIEDGSFDFHPSQAWRIPGLKAGDRLLQDEKEALDDRAAEFCDENDLPDMKAERLLASEYASEFRDYVDETACDDPTASLSVREIDGKVCVEFRCEDSGVRETLLETPVDTFEEEFRKRFGGQTVIIEFRQA